MRPLIFISSAAFLAITLSACNTVEGFGEDVEATGRTLQDWAGDDPAPAQPPAQPGVETGEEPDGGV